jgi:hypothetical protein
LVIAVPSIDQRHQSVFVTVLAGQDGCSARSTNGVGAVDILEKHALAGQSIDVLGWADFLEVTTVAPNTLPSVVVSHDIEDVRFRGVSVVEQ